MIPAASPSIGRKEIRSVIRVMRSGQISQGPEVAAFEAEFSEQVVENAECVAVNSGTSALHLILLGLGIGCGDEVIVPSFTFAATANAVALTGAKPVFVDIEFDSFCIDPLAVENAMTPRTKAIMPVHMYGHPAKMEQLTRLCAKWGMDLIEDAAHAHLASIGGQKVGTWGTAAAFSFYPTKNMTTGEGGMVVTRSSDLAHKIRLLRNQGQEIRYHNELVGLNNRMTDINAAIGRVQLRKLRDWTLRRRDNAQFFSDHIRGVGLPLVADGVEHSFHQYTIRIQNQNRDTFSQRLADLGVGSGIYYPIPVHQLPSFAGNHSHMPATAEAVKQVLSIPVHPRLKRAELRKITQAVNQLASLQGSHE